MFYTITSVLDLKCLWSLRSLTPLFKPQCKQRIQSDLSSAYFLLLLSWTYSVLSLIVVEGCNECHILKLPWWTVLVSMRECYSVGKIGLAKNIQNNFHLLNWNKLLLPHNTYFGIFVSKKGFSLALFYWGPFLCQDNHNMDTYTCLIIPSNSSIKFGILQGWKCCYLLIN